MNITVSTELCNLLLGYASRKGLDSDGILNEIGFNRSLLTNSFERISIEDFGFLWNKILKRSKDPNFGLNFGISGYSIKGGGILASILKNCPNLGVALEKLILYHDISGELSRFELKQLGSLVSITVSPFYPGVELQRHSAESILAALFSTIKELTGGNFSLLKICFAHPEPDEIDEHKKIFNTQLLFNQTYNQLVFDKKYLYETIFLANDILLESLQQFAQKQIEQIKRTNQWSYKVQRKAVEILLNGDKPGVEIIAGDLNMSARTLQGKLKSESTNYQEILDLVRKDIALSYIEKPGITINDLAFLLAYSDQSAFNHSFKRWTGKSPLEYKKRGNKING